MQAAIENPNNPFCAVNTIADPTNITAYTTCITNCHLISHIVRIMTSNTFVRK